MRAKYILAIAYYAIIKDTTYNVCKQYKCKSTSM